MVQEFPHHDKSLGAVEEDQAGAMECAHMEVLLRGDHKHRVAQADIVYLGHAQQQVQYIHTHYHKIALCWSI